MATKRCTYLVVTGASEWFLLQSSNTACNRALALLYCLAATMLGAKRINGLAERLRMSDHEYQPSSSSGPLKPGRTVPPWARWLLAKWWGLLVLLAVGLLTNVLLLPLSQKPNTWLAGVQDQVQGLLALPKENLFLAVLLAVVIPLLSVAGYLAHRELARHEEDKQQKALTRATLEALEEQTAALKGTLAQQNRTRMLKRLGLSYESVLAQSLEGVAWLDLGLAQQPTAVQNATTLLLRRAQRAEQLLPAGTSIIQVYEGAAEELLILGDPGAGKSTLLLQLASHLVERAKQEDTQPLPVILPLASWAVSRPHLEDWLAEQVDQLYDTGQQVARAWVQNNQLLPLLDGLDEMEDAAQPTCIEEINDYHREHPRPLVVCSRTAQYAEAAKLHKLILQSAVVVQPLAPEQVEATLAQVGEPLEGLRQALKLKKHTELLKLANTPLMLSVLMLTYRGKSVRFVSREAEELQQQVWTDYVQRMVETKGDTKRSPLERTQAQLHWLARQMRDHNQAIFYLEHLQPDWLPIGRQRTYAWLAVWLPGILVGVLASLVVVLFWYCSNGQVALLGYGIGGTPGLVNLGSNINLVALLQYSVIGGFLGGLFSTRVGSPAISRPPPSTTDRWLYDPTVLSAFIGLLYGLIFGLNLGPNYGLGDWLLDGYCYGVAIWLSCWVLLEVMPRLSARQALAPATTSVWHWLNLRRLLRAVHLRRALLVATVLGLSYSLSGGLIFWLRSRQQYGLSSVLVTGLIDGLTPLLLFGFISILVSLILDAQSSIVHLRERLKWTWGSLMRSLLSARQLRTTMVLVGLVLVLVGFSIGLTTNLFYTVFNMEGGGVLPLQNILLGGSQGLTLALGRGLSTGLSAGLSAGLNYWLLIGLAQGIASEQVEDEDRRVFNQGIRHSLRNSLGMGLLSGGIIWLISMLVFGLQGGLGNMLDYWLGLPYSGLPNNVLSGTLNQALSDARDFGLNIGWLLAVSGGLLVWTMMGGLAVLRHSVLRLLLWRLHTFPWQAARFLEDARARILVQRVGGGYRFIHRLLLDYFADLQTGTSAPSPPTAPPL